MPHKFKRVHGERSVGSAESVRHLHRWDRGFTASRRWRAIREQHLREHPLCVECMKHNRITPAKEVDHIVPRRDAPERAFDPANLQSLCPTCHGQKTRDEYDKKSEKPQVF